VQRTPGLLAACPPVLRRHDFVTGFGKKTWENLMGKLKDERQKEHSEYIRI
jgi:hypothetical protein